MVTRLCLGNQKNTETIKQHTTHRQHEWTAPNTDLSPLGKRERNRLSSSTCPWVGLCSCSTPPSCWPSGGRGGTRAGCVSSLRPSYTTPCWARSAGWRSRVCTYTWCWSRCSTPNTSTTSWSSLCLAGVSIELRNNLKRQKAKVLFRYGMRDGKRECE